MNGRVYDNVIGRFISADPMGVRPGDTQTWNRYSYVMNCSLSAIGPSGFAESSLVLRDCDLRTSCSDRWGLTGYETRTEVTFTSSSGSAAGGGSQPTSPATQSSPGTPDAPPSQDDSPQSDLPEVPISADRPSYSVPVLASAPVPLQGNQNLPEVSVSHARPVSGPPVIPISPFLAPSRPV